MKIYLPTINPLKPNSSNYYTLAYRPNLPLLTHVNPLKGRGVKLSYRSNLPFVIFDIRALWRSGLSARVPECQKLKMVG